MQKFDRAVSSETDAKYLQALMLKGNKGDLRRNQINLRTARRLGDKTTQTIFRRNIRRIVINNFYNREIK